MDKRLPDHAHNVATRRSIAGLNTFVECTLVSWKVSIDRYIFPVQYTVLNFLSYVWHLRKYFPWDTCYDVLGVPIFQPTTTFGGNWDVIQNATIPGAKLKKKTYKDIIPRCKRRCCS